jgi:hypothetical protein
MASRCARDANEFLVEKSRHAKTRRASPIISTPDHRPTAPQSNKGDDVPQTVAATVLLPVHLRSRLEQVRFGRAERGQRLPRLRDLLLEAIGLLIEREDAIAAAAKAVR